MMSESKYLLFVFMFFDNSFSCINLICDFRILHLTFRRVLPVKMRMFQIFLSFLLLFTFFPFTIFPFPLFQDAFFQVFQVEFVIFRFFLVPVVISAYLQLPFSAELFCSIRFLHVLINGVTKAIQILSRRFFRPIS